MRAEHRRAEVIEHDDRHPGKVDPHIEGRLVQHVVGGTHEGEGRTGEDQPHQDENCAADDADEDGGVDRFLDVFFVPGPIKTGHQDVGAHRKSDEYVDDSNRMAFKKAKATDGYVSQVA